MSVQSRLVVKVYLITIRHKNKSLLYHATGSTVHLLFGFLFKDPNDKKKKMLSVLSDKRVVFIRFVQRSGLRVIARPSQSKVCLQFVCSLFWCPPQLKKLSYSMSVSQRCSSAVVDDLP